MSLTRIGSIGINTGIAFAGVTTIVTLNTANDALSIGATVNVGSGITLGASGDIFATGVSTVTTLKVGSGITVSSDGDIFATGVCTATSFSGSGANLTGIDTDLVSDTSPQLGGNLDVNTKNIVFGDSGGATDDRLTFGAGTDLSIYHDGSNSFMVDSGTGSLVIQTSALAVKNAAGSENMLVATENGNVELMHDNSKKLETTSSGGTLYGDWLADANFLLADSDKIKLGDGADLQIYHDGSNSYLANTTGTLLLQNSGQTTVKGSTVQFENAAGTEVLLKAIQDGAVELYHNNTKMLETISTGTNIPDGKFAKFGNSNDMSMGHNTYNYITYTGADFLITGDATNQIKLQPKSDEAAIICKPNAEVELFHDGTLQCETSANGLAFPSGKGIDFSLTANSSGSTSSELLDDYEEGTWSPTLSSGTATTYLNQWYTKIGQVVTCYVYLYNFSDTSSNTHFNISGLPFSYKTNHEATVQFMSNGSASLASNCMGIWGRIGVTGNSDQIAVYTHFNTTGGGIFKHSNLGSTHLMATFTYVTGS